MTSDYNLINFARILFPKPKSVIEIFFYIFFNVYEFWTKRKTTNSNTVSWRCLEEPLFYFILFYMTSIFIFNKTAISINYSIDLTRYLIIKEAYLKSCRKCFLTDLVWLFFFLESGLVWLDANNHFHARPLESYVTLLFTKKDVLSNPKNSQKFIVTGQVNKSKKGKNCSYYSNILPK